MCSLHGGRPGRCCTAVDDLLLLGMAASQPSSPPWAAASTYDCRGARTQGEAALTSEPRSRGGAWCVYARSRGEPANCASRADPLITTGDTRRPSAGGAHPRRNEPIAHPIFFRVVGQALTVSCMHLRLLSFTCSVATVPSFSMHGMVRHLHNMACSFG